MADLSPDLDARQSCLKSVALVCREYLLPDYAAYADAANETITALRSQLAELGQYRHGHTPECGGMDLDKGTCGCGYLDGTAYRDLVARAETAERSLAEQSKALIEARAEIARLTPKDTTRGGPSDPVAIWFDRANAAEAELATARDMANECLLKQRTAEAELATALAQNDGCICAGNWRLIVAESAPLLDRQYRDRDGNLWTFYGIVHGSDDYYYGMYRYGQARLISCVGNIEMGGFTLVDAALSHGDRDMSERPILFSGPMVRALLDGHKTQTRRVVKEWHRYVEHDKWECRTVTDGFELALVGAGRGFPLRCPHGKPGDHLWVRETWAHVPIREVDGGQGDKMGYVYRANGDEALDDMPDEWDLMGWSPSIFMPRLASRITLEITDVRVERLQDISEDDARDEGVELSDEWTGAAEDLNGSHAKAYRFLWDSINAKRAPWSSNPFVWAITFKAAQSPDRAG